MKNTDDYRSICEALRALDEAIRAFDSSKNSDCWEGSCDGEKRIRLMCALDEVASYEGMPEHGINFEDVVSSRDVWEEGWVTAYYKPEDKAYQIWANKSINDDAYTEFLNEDHDRASREYDRVSQEAWNYLHNCKAMGYDYDKEEDDEQ